MKKISLGIDTSCYTTSLVAIDDASNILFEERILLTVKEGTLGLRQSDAFFQHVQNLPKLYNKLCNKINIQSVVNLVVSNTPRPLENSYMPVFTAGVSFAKVISDSLEIPLMYISHQENHLYASLFEMNRELSEFVGIHISGGTSEILKVSNKEKLHIELIGKSLDLSFGKLIDRLGVYMGLFFPCGKELDKLARVGGNLYNLRISSKGSDFNISGIENKLKEEYDKNNNKEDIARTLFEYIAKVLIKQLNYAVEVYEIDMIVMSGGVSANTIIRSRLEENFGDRIIFSSIKYATDHAIGNAYYGKMVIIDEVKKYEGNRSK